MTLAAPYGVPESALAGTAVLPDSTPGAPWACVVEALVWWHRATPAAVQAVDPRLRDRVGRALTVGAVIRYAASPVGAYDEVLASPVMLGGGLLGGGLHAHVPFIAVDSEASVQGGREHWSLPKALAAFTRDGAGSVARGDGWTVSAAPGRQGPPLPSVLRFASTQVGPSGPATARSSLVGRSRLTRVTVDVRSDGDLAGWLLPGRHLGAAVRGRLTVGAPSSR